MIKSSLSIGIFDSGIGGLTVVREVMKLLPLENIVYMGDTARLPYGTKSRKTVIGYSRKNSRFLISKGVKFLIVACNTASAYAIETLENEFAVPVLGVIKPGARKACEVTKNGKIGVIATPSTVRSGAYARALEAENPLLETFSLPCPLFVPLTEEGWHEDEIALQIARKYLDSLKQKQVDTLILGCTHYPLMKETIARVMGGETVLVDSAEETAKEAAGFLKQNGLLNEKSGGTAKFHLTDGSESFLGIARRFLGNEIGKISVVDL